MLQRKGVIGIERIFWLVVIDTVYALRSLNIEIEVLLLDTSRCIERPDACARRYCQIGTHRVDGLIEVDVFAKHRICLSKEVPLGDGIRQMFVRGSERNPLVRYVQRQVAHTLVEQL